MGILGQVFRKPIYLFLAIFVNILTVVFIVLAPNAKLIFEFISNEGFVAGVALAANLLRSIGENFTTLGAITTILLGALLGINVSLLAYRIRQARKSSAGSVATTGLGFFVGLIGVGCAACGTALLSAILPLAGVAGALAFLPFGGTELQVLAIALLVFSIWRLIKDLASPAVCKIPLVKS